MKIIVQSFLIIVISIVLFACEKDDSHKACTENCTTVIGRIARADNTGISDVEVTFSFVQFAPYSYKRVIAKTKTDQDGNYEFQAYINDNELGALKTFQVIIDKEKVEAALSDDYLKPSDLLLEIVPQVEEIFLPGIEHRNDIINVPNFIVPYKTDLTVKLNNYIPITETDQFGFIHRVEYGFENQFILCTNNRAVEQNSQFTFKASVGNNRVRVFKWKNNVDSNEIQDINLSTIPSNQVLNFEF